MYDTMTDAELVAGHLSGDAGALAAIYDRYAGSLYDTAAAMTRQRDDAADVLQDVFVAAAERLTQLRDPEKLKPWLFAILRNEVYRRTDRRRRTVTTDFTDPVAEMSAPSQPADDATSVEYDELAALVRAASAGLDERDQLVLELSVRHGLQGDDLAAALGVSAQQCYGLVHRMRQRTERSLGAYCVARAGRKDCPELAEILRTWDGQFTVLVRKRVARHVDGCGICERSRRTLAPFALFGAAPVLAAPAGTRDRVLAAAGAGHTPPPYPFEAPGGFPALVRYGRRLGLWMFLTAALVLLGVGAAAVVLADGDDSVAVEDGTTTTQPTAPSTAIGSTTSPESGPTSSSAGAPASSVPVVASGPTTTTADPASTTTSPTSTTIAVPASTVVGTTIASGATPPAATTPPPATTAPPASTTTPPPPGALAVSAGSLHFDTTVDEAQITLSNTGGEAVDWSASSGPLALRGTTSPFTFRPAAGSLAPGASVQVVFEIDRSWPTEGPVPARRVTFVADGTGAAVDLTGVVGRPPVIRGLALPPRTSCIWFHPDGLTWQVAIADESRVVGASVEVTTPGGTVLSAAMTERGDWYGLVSSDGDGDGTIDPGAHRWTVRATDAFGNVGTLTGTTTLSAERIDC